MPRGTAPELVVCALDATQGLEAFLIETEMVWYYCSGCKKKLQRGRREMLVAGGKSYCLEADRWVRLKEVKRKRSRPNGN